MFDWLRRLFASKTRRIREGDEDPLYHLLVMKQRCPDCGDSPIKLYAGPSGGTSTNVFCSNCGHGYNITPMILRADDIGVKLEYCDNVQIRARRAIEQKFTAALPRR